MSSLFFKYSSAQRFEQVLRCELGNTGQCSFTSIYTFCNLTASSLAFGSPRTGMKCFSSSKWIFLASSLFCGQQDHSVTVCTTAEPTPFCQTVVQTVHNWTLSQQRLSSRFGILGNRPQAEICKLALSCLYSIGRERKSGRCLPCATDCQGLVAPTKTHCIGIPF